MRLKFYNTAIGLIILLCIVRLGAANAYAEGFQPWQRLVILEAKEIIIIRDAIVEFQEKGHRIENYDEVYFEKNELAYRITFISKFHAPDTFGVKPGLPQDIEVLIGLSGTPIEIGNSH